MTRTFAALALACALRWPASADARHRVRHRHGTFCAPVIAEGVGLIRICGVPNRARR